MIITEMGVAYRISKTDYKKFLQDVLNGTYKDKELEFYGAKRMGVAKNVTNICKEDAQMELDYLRG